MLKKIFKNGNLPALTLLKCFRAVSHFEPKYGFGLRESECVLQFHSKKKGGGGRIMFINCIVYLHFFVMLKSVNDSGGKCIQIHSFKKADHNTSAAKYYRIQQARNKCKNT